MPRADGCKRPRPKPAQKPKANPLDGVLTTLAADASPRVRAWARWLKSGDKEGGKRKAKRPDHGGAGQ